MPIGKKQIEEALIGLPRLSAAIKAVPAIYLQCPDFPHEYIQTAADELIHVFCRHSLRTVYYARNFLTNLLNLRTVQLEEFGVGRTIGIPIQDDAFLTLMLLSLAQRAFFRKLFYVKGLPYTKMPMSLFWSSLVKRNKTLSTEYLTL